MLVLPFLSPTPRLGLTRIAVGMAVSKAGYLPALSNLCDTAHLPLFGGFGRVKDIRPGNFSARFSEMPVAVRQTWRLRFTEKVVQFVWTMYPGTCCAAGYARTELDGRREARAGVVGTRILDTVTGSAKARAASKQPGTVYCFFDQPYRHR